MMLKWRELVLHLAGPAAQVRETADSATGKVVIQAVIQEAAFTIIQDDEEAAWGMLAYQLADLRLAQSLEAAGWTILDQVVDETTYVVAREPNGDVWAIGVSATGDGRRPYLERDMRLDTRPARLGFVDPWTARDQEAVVAELASQPG